jgi:hypothetical protein
MAGTRPALRHRHRRHRRDAALSRRAPWRQAGRGQRDLPQSRPRRTLGTICAGVWSPRLARWRRHAARDRAHAAATAGRWHHRHRRTRAGAGHLVDADRQHGAADRDRRLQRWHVGIRSRGDPCRCQRRYGAPRGAITATVRIPLVDGTVSRTVNWADGESGPQQVELPFDARWNHFLAELDAPPRTRLGSPSMVAVQVATASTTTVASTTTTSGTSTTTPASTPASGSSGGGALDAVTLTWLLAALLASASRVAGARRPRPGWPFPRVSDGRTPASRRRH